MSDLDLAPSESVCSRCRLVYLTAAGTDTVCRDCYAASVWRLLQAARASGVTRADVVLVA